ncbi:glycosidase [Candidatus Parcubacteria bacterium]|nr:glycosidase [Candidatus Parcubacteria bacterium]
MKFRLERYPNNKNSQPILTPRKDIEWEAAAVFNPSVVHNNGTFHMLYRTYTSETKELEQKEHRPGFKLKHQISYIGYASSTDGINFKRRDTPFISPDQPYDKFGVEDPRITKIGDTFYITYTAIDKSLESKEKERPNVRIALASTKDFQAIEKHGIIGPPETSKAAAFFPEKVNGGKIGLLMTIASDSTNSHVALRYYDSMDEVVNQTDESWREFLSHSMDTAVLKTYWWLHRGPELGASPIKTDKGWLLIYSAEGMSHTWTTAAALTDLNEPHKLIARTPGYILEPVTDYEREGLVPQVTFPEAAVIVGDKLYVYYGGADTVIGLAMCNLQELLDYLENFKGK